MRYVERFVEQEFKEWKEKYSCYTLEVTGCRQVGKTTTVLHFAHENYQNVVYVDSVADRDKRLLTRACEHSVEKCLAEYCRCKGISFSNDKDTVLVLDEIQESKSLYERIRVFTRCLDCDVIVISSNLQKAVSYFQPAGDTTQVRVYPLSYEEYLKYFGLYKLYNELTIEQLCKEGLEKFSRVYQLYLRVGGYPVVFNTYLEGEDTRKAF